MELYLIRHTRVDADGRCYGRSDMPLSSSFDDEVNNYKNLLPIKFTKVFCSPMTRCVLLSEALGYQNVTVDERLAEFFYGDWERKRWEEIPKEAFDGWTSDLINGGPPNGETLYGMYTRIASFFDELKKKNYERVLIITHAGVLRCVKTYMENLSLSDIFYLPIGFGEVYRYSL